MVARFNRYNRWVRDQQRKERTFKSLDEVRREASPYFPRAFLEGLYNLDSLSFVTIQVDKILAFKEVSPSPAAPETP